MRRVCALTVTFALVAACSSNSGDTSTSVPLPPAASTTTATAPPTAATTVPQTTTTAAPTTTTTTVEVPTGFTAAPSMRPKELPPFASFTPVPLLDRGSYPGPAAPVSLTGVLIPGSLDGLLDEAAAATLARQGFVIEPTNWPVPEFFMKYQSFGYEDDVFFVTTDVAYHYLHLAFAKVLRETEEKTLLPVLQELVRGAVQGARAQQAELAGTGLADASSRVTQLFEAAATLLGLDVGPIGPLAEAEVALATEALQITSSPVTSFADCFATVSAAGCVDYSLFKPRGHYTRSEDLRRFFTAMSLLGQASFFLDQPQSVQLGLLTSRVLSADPGLNADWKLIYEPTSFMVGAADDFTPLEVADAVTGLIPDGLADPTVFNDAALLDDVVEALLATREVAINPEAAAIRIMGARFVIDSWIIDQLVWPNVGTEDKRRVFASPLDVAASFGSEPAYGIQDAAGETGYLHYDEQMDEMRRFVADRPVEAWASTVYDAWLYALAPMWAPHGDPYPQFMQTEAWAAKDLQTAFGSYAELKHDTILYAKQSFAAEGEFPPARFQPRHWVEPDPVAFRRMSAALGMLSDGLAARNLLDASNRELLGAMVTMIDRFGRIAADELAGVPISGADNDWLAAIGPQLEALWVQASDWDPDLQMPSSGEEEEAAIVADIARTTGYYLEIGTGHIDTIYVLVPNDDGRFQVARGGVYSYYEFWQPADQGRLTDEEWRRMLREGSQPDRPAWQAVLFPAAVEPSVQCAALAGASYSDVVAEFVLAGRPADMDRNGDGTPCEELFPEAAELFDAVRYGVESGLYCRDLEPLGYSFLQAVAYWLAEGAPNRMDADRDGIPCETVYPADEIDRFLGR